MSLAGGVGYVRRGTSCPMMHVMLPTPLPHQTEWQMPIKTLPSHNCWWAGAGSKKVHGFSAKGSASTLKDLFFANISQNCTKKNGVHVWEAERSHFRCATLKLDFSFISFAKVRMPHNKKCAITYKRRRLSIRFKLTVTLVGIQS